MKITVHNNVLRHEEINITYNPMRVMLTGNVELLIEKGDKLSDVVKAIRPHMPWFDRKTLMGIVTFYFAMGERAAAGRYNKPWTRKESRVRKNRRYLRGIS